MAKPTHVMVVVLAAQGHLNPMLQFAERLAEKGLHVSLAMTHTARKRILRAQPDHPTAMAKVGRVWIESFSDGIDEDAERTVNITYYMERLASIGQKSLTELILRLADEGRAVSCLVNNPFMPWVLDIGTQLQIPCASLWIQSCALYAVYYRYYHKLTQFPETGSDPGSGHSVTLPGLPPLEPEDLPSLILPTNPYQVFARLLEDQFQKKNGPKWVFANSVLELELDAVESILELQPIKTVGPLVPSQLIGRSDGNGGVRVDMWEAARGCLEWLDDQPDKSVIYISLGSLVLLQADQAVELAWALKNSRVRFLWVAKGNQDQSRPMLPENLLDEVSDLGRFVSWCPQTDVLKHRAVAGFLTHCGWNSSLETLSAGVPVIAFPQWTDQPTNAKFLVDVYRVGVRLQVGPNRIATREEVHRCIEELMLGEKAMEMRRNALKWKDAVTKAGLDGGSSDGNIQAFVDELVLLGSQREPV